MANNSTVRELQPKPGTVRSVFARETIGLSRDQLTVQGIQERDQQNRELIVANVFGTVPPKQPQTDIISQLNRIVGKNQSKDRLSSGTITAWTELNQTTQQSYQLILLNTNTVIQTEIPDLMTTLFTDSLFPVLMFNGYKPFFGQSEDFNYGIHLYLMGNKTIQTTERTVRFVSAANQQKVFTCPTYAAVIKCLVRIDEHIINQTINQILDPNNPSYGVIGLCAPVSPNPPLDPQRVARDIITDSIIGYSGILFANRFTYLVANDGLLCVNEKYDINIRQELMASLLKSDTYCLCDGLATVRSYKKRFSLKGLFKNQPYIERIIIVGEGVNHLLLERIADESVPEFSYVESHLRQHDLSVEICYLNLHQLSVDLHSHRTDIGQRINFRQLMKLSEIGDHFIFHYKEFDTYVGDIVFSLFNNFSDLSTGFTDHWSVFICLDNVANDGSDYQYCSTIVVKYPIKSYNTTQMLQPNIFYPNLSKQPIKPIEMTIETKNRWTMNGQKNVLPWLNKHQLYYYFLASIELAPINRFGNIGVNLIDRFWTIKKFRLKFPSKAMKDETGRQYQSSKRSKLQKNI